MRDFGKKWDQARPEHTDAARDWQAVFRDIQVPLYLEDLTAVTRDIQAVLADGIVDFRSWLDAHPEFLHKAMGQIRILDVNDTAVRLAGAANRAELLSSLDRLFLPETLAAFKESVVCLAEGQAVYQGTTKYQTLGGHEYYALNQARLPRLTDDPALMVLSTIDITRQESVQVELQESEKRYRFLVESARDVIVCLGMDGTITFINQAGVDLSGWPHDELVGRHWRDLVPAAPDGGDLADLTLYETIIRTRNGDEIPVEVNTRVIPAGPGQGDGHQLMAMVRDISRRKEKEQDRQGAQERLVKSQKLESLGVLAGGISHYFNNILATIVGNTELLQMGLNQDPRVSDKLTAIREAAAEAAEFCGQMQAYAGTDSPAGTHLNISAMVAEMAPLLKVSVQRRAEFNLQLADDPPDVVFADAQLRQVMVNLVANAAQAMPDTGGEIVVRTGVENFSTADLAAGNCLPSLPAGDYVYCEVADSGHGMAPETAARLFEPLFTTRSGSRGLGLSVAMGIVQTHGGAFLLQTGPGKGTSLRFLLPPVPKVGKAAKSRKAPDSLHLNLAGKMVLIVDEDAGVRKMSESMIRRLGCKVLSTASGYDAVRIFGERHDEIDAVLLDLTMTLLDGPETCRRLRVIHPHLPVVFTTGQGDEVIAERTGEFEHCRVVHKPFTLAELRFRMAEVLAPK